jgi:hypothetical protein
MTGNYGLSFQTDERWHSGNQYHHIFDAIRPGVLPYGVTRNVQGLFYHNTPVYIGSDTSGPFCDFTNLPGVKPDIGDDSIWLLVVDGPELAKEVFILDSAWADFVFEPGYKLPPLAEVENFTKENHHLPDIPSAKEMAKTGIPVGRTEAAITKQLEEAMLYITQLSHKIDSLESKVEDLEKER